jgi:anaerobic nitric oxide reductase transcription regulator
VFPLSVPALRERENDVVLLAGYFCEQCRLRMGLAQVILSEATRARLQQWPGRATCANWSMRFTGRWCWRGRRRPAMKWCWSRSISSLPGSADVADVSPQPAAEAVNLREATEAFQREAISRALAANGRNWAATARALELDVANLHRLAKRLGLKGSRPGKSSAG